MTETWALWFPEAGAAGISFARTKIDENDAGDRVLVHAAAPVLEVTVRDEDGRVSARGDGCGGPSRGRCARWCGVARLSSSPKGGRATTTWDGL